MAQQTTALVKHSSASQEAINLRDYTDNELPSRRNLQFISSGALKQGTHIVAGIGSGKSRLLSRVFAWQQLIQGKPAVIMDPTGGVTDNLFDKILRLPPAYQEQLWPRIVYIQPGNKDFLFPTPLYYRLTPKDTFFEIANRLPHVIQMLDPQLTGAPILGMNSIYECLIYAGQIAAALDRQLDFVTDLIEHPSHYKGLLREVVADHPDLRPAVEYMRVLMDPKASSLREKRTGSTKTKLLPFLADPSYMATYAAKTNSLDWLKLLRQRKITVIDSREQRNAQQAQFTRTWLFKTFIEAIEERGAAGRGQEVMLILDEITALLGQRAHDGQSILAEDLEKLVSRLGRGFGSNIIIAHQGLYQLDERIQNVLMNMGNQIIGQLSVPDDARRVADQYLRYDYQWVKKYENVWGTVHPPAILSFFGGPDHPYPRVIDRRSIEFTFEEQLRFLTEKFLALDRFQFLTQIATAEGGRKGPVRKISIANLDKNQYPNEAILAPLREALAKRDGIPIEKLLAEIQSNRIEVLPAPEREEKRPNKQQKKREKNSATITMEHDHDNPTNATPAISHSDGPGADSGHSTRGASGSGDFWEAKTN